MRAVAQGYTAEPKSMFDDEKVRKAMGNMLRAGTIRFAVLEVLKGRAVSPELEMRGVLVDWDDFNDQKTVPYTFVRPDGRRGTCYANTYRTGAEYLLFLSRDASGYGLYDAALAPINEQVRGADDPWAAWVRRRAGTGASNSP